MVSVKKGSAISQDIMLRQYYRDSVLKPFKEGPFDRWEKRLEKSSMMTPDMKQALKQLDQSAYITRKDILTERDGSLSLADVLLNEPDLEDFESEND